MLVDHHIKSRAAGNLERENNRVAAHGMHLILLSIALPGTESPPVSHTNIGIVLLLAPHCLDALIQ